LDYNGITATTPFQVEAPVNSTRSINALSPQGGYDFSSWSIGGAAGLDGTEAAALEIDGQTVAIFNNIGGDLNAGVFDTLTHTHTSTLTNEPIRVRFTNNNGSARDLRIDAITVDGTRIESELGYSEGHWDTTNGCAGGYENTETLHCNGSIDYQLP
jgi:hypothetical protein